VTPIAALEAILFVTEAPVPVGELAEVLELSTDEVELLLAELGRTLDERGSGLTVRRVAKGWRLYSRAEAYAYLERFSTSATSRKLSGAALEVLSVVAYRQPVSRGQISEVRGVDSERALHTLERRGLVREIGTAPGPGQALLYGTTELFLEKLGIDHPQDLPPLADHVPPAEVVETLERPFRPEGSSNDSRN
jgi:segregation and condensation protein B